LIFLYIIQFIIILLNMKFRILQFLTFLVSRKSSSCLTKIFFYEISFQNAFHISYFFLFLYINPAFMLLISMNTRVRGVEKISFFLLLIVVVQSKSR